MLRDDEVYKDDEYKKGFRNEALFFVQKNEQKKISESRNSV